jgi:hypothetical protein
MLLVTAFTSLATLLAQGYGGGGKSGSSGGGSGRSYGGSISYGPGFWAIVAVVSVGLIIPATWLVRRYRSRSSTARGTSTSEMRRAA